MLGTPPVTDCNACARLDTIEQNITLLNGEVTIIQTEVDNLTVDVEELTSAFNDFLIGPLTLRKVNTFISNSQLKAGSSVALAPATTGLQYPVAIRLSLVYGGNNPFTNAPPFTIFYENPGAGASFQDLDTNSTFWQATADSTHMTMISGRQNILTATWIDGNNRLRGQPQSALTGNAANDNSVNIEIYYLVVGS